MSDRFTGRLSGGGMVFYAAVALVVILVATVRHYVPMVQDRQAPRWPIFVFGAGWLFGVGAIVDALSSHGEKALPLAVIATAALLVALRAMDRSSRRSSLRP
jgi:hypothetical protein